MNALEIKTTYVDIPEVQETFVDNVRSVIAADGVLRVELCATRLDEPHPPAPPTGRTCTAARLALTIPAAMNLQAILLHHITEMEKQGVFKRNAPTPSPAAPKH